MGTTNQDVFEDSVPTDLTVSLSGPQGDSLQDASDANDDVRLGLSKLVKSLRSEVQLQKLALNKKQAAIDHLNVQQKVQLELLEQKLRLSEGDVQLLRKENETLSEQIEKLQKENLRLQSESAVAKGDPTKPSIAVQSAISSKREDTVQISLAKHHSEKSCTVELPAKKTDPTIAENIRADKSTEKWKRKFCKLRKQFDIRLEREISALHSNLLRQQVEMQRSGSSHAQLEMRLVETEHQRTKASKQIHQLQAHNDELKRRLRDVEASREKMRMLLESAEAAKSELRQRLSSMHATKVRLETDLKESTSEFQATTDALKLDLLKQERLASQLQLSLHEKSEKYREMEEAFLAIADGGVDLPNWPLIVQAQSQHVSRMNKKVTQLETENGILQNQSRVLAETIHQLESELESKERLVSDLNSKAPETIGLFRDKDAQLRQLMTQLNRKDVQLADYARQIDKLKRTRNQLASDLEKILKDRTQLEAVRRILSQVHGSS